MAYLLSKERDNHGRYTVKQPAGRRSSAAVVNYSRDLLEQVFVGTIANVKDSRVILALKFTPSLGYNSSNSCCFNRFHDHDHQTSWVIDDNTSESDVDRLRSAFEESCEIFRGFVGRGLSEKEARDT